MYVDPFLNAVLYMQRDGLSLGQETQGQLKNTLHTFPHYRCLTFRFTEPAMKTEEALNKSPAHPQPLP